MSSNVKCFKLILGALFKNKFRFGEETSKKKKICLIALLALAYIAILAFVLIITLSLGILLNAMGMPTIGYFIILLVGAAIVLVFGIINLVTTLYLTKDTDFYSVLPVSPTAVFVAKLLFVYLTEAAIVAAVVLPALIVFGVAVKAWAGYYIISVLTLPIMPALPLIVAAIFATPVMYLAGKLKNRNAVPMIFYCVMFLAMFALYFYLMFSSMSSGDEELTQEQLEGIVGAITAIGYILYPYTALSSAALFVPTFGLGGGASVAVNLIIFIGISAALFCLLVALGKVMYGQSARSNNQTDNSRAKKGEFRSNTGLWALIKREFIVAARTPATMFQCFGVLLFPIAFSVILSLGFGSMSFPTEDGGTVAVDPIYLTSLILSILIILMPTLSNAAITSFSREGSALSGLKVLPLSAKQLVAGKVAAWSLVAVPSSLISAIIVNAFNFYLPYLMLSVFAFIILPFIYVAFGVMWDLSAPKLKWNDPVQAIKHNTHATIGQLLSMLAGGAVTVVGGLVPMILSLSRTATTLMLWITVFALLIVFLIADVVLYGSVDKYYNRVEL